MTEIYNIDYNNHVKIIGTTHFTTSSINDAYKSIRSLKPSDIALELDWTRFKHLNTACLTCPRRESCIGLCEFTAAAEALGNVNANIWLIDMTEQEMRHRMRSKMSLFEMARTPIHGFKVENLVCLWRKGLKDRVIRNSKKNTAILQKISQPIWRVLIDERDALMSARIAWIASKNLNEGKQPRILTFVGAAHVEGIKKLLRNPILIKEKLKEFNLSFTKPALIRRVAIQ